MIYQPYLDDTRVGGSRQRRAAHVPVGTGSPTSSSARRTAATSRSTRSSRGARSRRMSSSSASTPSRWRGSRAGRSSGSMSRTARASARRSGSPSSARTTAASASRFLASIEARAGHVRLAGRPLQHLRLPEALPPPARGRRPLDAGRRHAPDVGGDAHRVRGPDAGRARLTAAGRGRRARRHSVGDVRGDPPPGRAPAPLPRHGGALLGAASRAARSRLPPAARAGRGRRLARPRGTSVLRGRARPRVPVRILLPRRDRRDRLPGALGKGSRRASARCSSSSSTGLSTGASGTRSCTCTTTPPTSARR